MKAGTAIHGHIWESVMDIEQVRKAWQARGFDCHVWTDSPGQVWADFVHSVDELVMLVTGEIELSCEGKTLRPQIGEEVFIPAGASHTVRNVGSTTNRWCFGYRRSGDEQHCTT
jgi:mannose-6-phosphate isomerase-like protein (cupin superfamily)